MVFLHVLSFWGSKESATFSVYIFNETTRNEIHTSYEAQDNGTCMIHKIKGLMK